MVDHFSLETISNRVVRSRLTGGSILDQLVVGVFLTIGVEGFWKVSFALQLQSNR